MSDPTEAIKALFKVMLIFEKPLDHQQFEHLKNRLSSSSDWDFPIWGNPIILGPRKMHVYGVNKRSWSQIMLDITSRYVMAVFPLRSDLEDIKSAISRATGIKLEEVE